MTAAQGTAVKAVSDAQSTATQAVQTAQTNAVSAVEKAGSEVLESIPEDYQTTVEKVEKLKTEKAEIDDTTVGPDAWSSKHIVDMLCPPLEETGNPVVCYPVASYPLGVKAKWEPMQEGSGTPYPAGGGKNLWGDLLQDTFVSQQGFSSGYSGAKTTGKIPCTEGDNYTLSCATTFAPTPGNIGVLAYFDASDTMLTRIANTYQRAFTLTAPANAAYLRASCYQETDADNVQLEKGSVATAYAPYENIRPIKGRDSVTVERCGENLLPFGERIEDIYMQQIMASADTLLLSKACAGQKLTLTFSVETQNIVFEDNVDEEWRKRVGFESHGTSTDGTEIWAPQCWLSDRDGELTKNGKKTKTITETMPEIVNGDITFYAQNIKSGNFVAYDFGIYAGTAAPTTYAPYTGQTATLTLPRTIYGGTVDAVTGEGQETWKLLTLDGTTNKFTQTEIFLNLPKNSAPGVGEWYLNNLYCSHFPNIFGGNATFGFLYTIMESMSKYFPDVDALNSYLVAQYAAGTPVQIAYKLATPTSFIATGVQPIPALSGVNTVLTDADSATVTGRADPIKRITDLEDAVASMT